MGNCLLGGSGGAALIEAVDGNEKDFHETYIEDRILGEGEFGVVKLVRDMRETDESKNTAACKILRKGVVFKDNTIYAPLKPEILKGEVEMLRTLNGEHCCMKLKNVYETPRVIFLVTEYCSGGDMMEYVSKMEDLRTEDVSRISFQMLDAVNHCAQNNIIHRDIKPENIMFQNSSPGSEVRLIDFGSGTNQVVEGMHTTFAGSAFYISPEMFQRTYTSKTDVWSVGVTLYVLVAGYPADVLQAAFNKLQSADRDLRQLPNLPDNMPDSFYDMLDGLLLYRHKKRKSAGDLLKHEFVQFHIVHRTTTVESDDKISALPEKAPAILGYRKTQSLPLHGTVDRHTQFLGYQKYQRSLTTMLATLLNKKELSALVTSIASFLADDSLGELKKEEKGFSETKLDIMHVREMKTILNQLRYDHVLKMIDKLPGAGSYDTFAYDVTLLKDFTRDDEEGDNLTSSVRSGGGRSRRGRGLNRSFNGVQRLGSFRGNSVFGRKSKADDLGNSIHSAGSLRVR